MSAFDFVQGSDSSASGRFAGSASFETDTGHTVEMAWDVGWGN